MSESEGLDALDRERRLLAKIARASEETAENSRPKLVRSRMTLREKVAFIAKNGQEKFLALPR